jgi:hypothetical protein
MKTLIATALPAAVHQSKAAAGRASSLLTKAVWNATLD